jgi:hypothetical protein
MELDIDSIDLMVHSTPDFDSQAPSLALQLKATADPSVLRPDRVAFALSRKNYDDLRRATQMLRFLVVFVLPENSADWFAQSESELSLRRAAYYLSLRGARPTTQQSVTVSIPRSNLLTPDAIREMMRGR